ncbi:MAG: Calx-beta domain-containing protein, partial [Planctomycetaceae bacterium]
MRFINWLDSLRTRARRTRRSSHCRRSPHELTLRQFDVAPLTEQLEDRTLLTVDFAIAANATISEAGGTATFTVTLSGDALTGGQTASVNLDESGSALSGTDYDDFDAAVSDAAAAESGVNLAGSTLTFDATFNGNSGTGNFQFTVNALNDTLVEGTQDITATLSSEVTNHPNGAAILTPTTSTDITDADSATVAFQNAAGSAAESAGATNVTLVLTTVDNDGGTATLESGQSIDVTAANGTAADADYEGSSAFPKTVTFGAASSSGATQNTTLDPTADTLVEGDQTVNLGLAATGILTGSGQTSSTFTITDDNTATVTVDAAQTLAEDGSA